MAPHLRGGQLGIVKNVSAQFYKGVYRVKLYDGFVLLRYIAFRVAYGCKKEKCRLYSAPDNTYVSEKYVDGTKQQVEPINKNAEYYRPREYQQQPGGIYKAAPIHEGQKNDECQKKVEKFAQHFR